MQKWLTAGLSAPEWPLEDSIKDYVQNYLSQKRERSLVVILLVQLFYFFQPQSLNTAKLLCRFHLAQLLNHGMDSLGKVNLIKWTLLHFYMSKIMTGVFFIEFDYAPITTEYRFSLKRRMYD